MYIYSLGLAQSPTPTQLPKTIAVNNTDLNAPYFGGNFNFLYNGGANEAFITFNTFLAFRKNYAPGLKKDFVDNLRDAVAVWDNAAEVQVKDVNNNYSAKIKLRFKLNLVSDINNANKKTDVHPTDSWSSWFNGKNREIVMRDLNVFIGSSRNTLIHELGHVWGLLDEYDTQWIEKKFSPGHVGTDSPLIKDTTAIMNLGFQNNSGEFRTRYFAHFGRAILPAFWGLNSYVRPTIHAGKVVSRTIQGRIALLKKDIAGTAPSTTDVPPFNPQFTNIQIAKR
ncbi:MAG: hypothetical protein HOP19_11060 [Acidobacteria bacterium]|nr:hypothetical protein [Acidobacteriota bacterium]